LLRVSREALELRGTVVFAERVVPLKVFWALLAAVVLAVGAVAFVVGAFIVRPVETVRVEVPAPGVGFPPQPVETLPKPDGPPPSNEARAREDVIEAFTVVSAGSSTDEERLARVDDSEGLAELRRQVLVNFPQAPLDEISVRVEEVRFLNQRTAAVRYAIVLPGYSIPEFPNRIGRAVLVGDTWKVTRQTVCADLLLGGVTCPR
jgi:hypothetical protein